MSAIVCILLVIVTMTTSPAEASDDVSAVETLLQQQAQIIEELKAKVASLENAVTAMKSRVAFAAHYSPGLVDVGSSNPPLKYDVVTANIGNGYNPATGVFTAPVPGLYFFALHLLHDADASHGFINVAIATAGAGSGDEELCRATVNARNTAGLHDQGACQVAVALAAGQQVFARRVGGTVYLHGDIYNFFTGFLVSADVA